MDVPLYHCIPSKAAAIVSTIVFAILTIIHIHKLFKTRTWFCIPFVVGLIFEILGYVARAYGNSDTNALSSYIAQTILILLAPILFAVPLYVFLGRIVLATGYTQASIIRPMWVTKIFLSCGTLCFLLQAVGAGMLAATDASRSTRSMGRIIILAGLLIQLSVFGFYVVVTAIFHVEANIVEGSKGAVHVLNWHRYLGMLYAVSGLLTLRTVFRVVEYATSEHGYLLANEWPLYLFDTLPMFTALSLSITWYVGDIVFLANHGEAYVVMAHQPNHEVRDGGYVA